VKYSLVKLNMTLALALLCVMILSLMAGRVWVPFDHWLSGDLRSLIIMELRLPRACIGALVGAALGMAGAAMQGYLRNPLADPGLFGISSSAALGAVTSLYFGYAVSAILLPIFALIGASLGMTALVLLAGRSGSLILFTLAGIILSSLTGSLTSLMISLAPTPFAASEIITWLMGALTDRSWDDLKLALPLMTIGMGLLLMIGRNLDDVG
jgi:iron complex transport system permease protein